MWTIRLTEELKDHTVASFVTLTYNDENLVYSDYLPTLYKPDLQKFIKRLRKSLKQKIRYYAVGEYGTKTIRPHYHLIIFNLSQYEVNKVAKAWSIKNKPIGNIQVSSVGIARLKYVTKYHVNRNQHPDTVAPEFALMSTKPAIGHGYINRMDRYHSRSINNCYYSDYEIKRPLPRYYRDKIYSDADREAIQEIASQRGDNGYKEQKKWELENPNKSYYEHLHYQIMNRERKFKTKRNPNETI